MIKILVLIIFFVNKSVVSEDFKLVCSEINSTLDIGLSRDFSKIVNFKDRTIVNYSGGFFDDLVLFGRNEIILNNKVFNTRSTFNIATNKWITYKDQYIKRYNCDKVKRRF
tara:strand:- start:129 stop:461 length:333 start_codon:yes stop_codon:yes gene_type:complete